MTRQTSSVRVALIAGLIASAHMLQPSASAAQAKFTFTPYIGSYYAVSDLFDDDIDLSNFDPSLSGTAHFVIKQTNTVMFGARAAIPIGSTVSAEASFGYAQSDIRLTGEDALAPGVDLATNTTGNVMLFSARAVLRPRRSNLSLIAGPLLVLHGGDAWDGADKKTSYGGVVGFGLRANVTPKFAVNIQGEVNLYQFDPDNSDNNLAGAFPGAFQQDVVVSIGIPIGGR